MEYRTIAAPVSASFVEKKSEFIAQLFPVRTQEDAVEAIENVRKQHRRARHNVYAYLLREGNASRYSDDGEPQGTAGMPILDVLQKNGLTDDLLCGHPIFRRRAAGSERVGAGILSQHCPRH